MTGALSSTEILTALDHLTRAELDQIASKIQLLKAIGTPTSVPAKQDADEDLLLLAIAEFFDSAGLENCTAAMLKRLPSHASFKLKAAVVTKYLVAATGSTIPRIEMLAYFSLSVGLLYKDMVNMGMTVSSRTLINQVHRIPAVLNKSFPGYAERHLLWLVIRKQEAHAKR